MKELLEAPFETLTIASPAPGVLQVTLNRPKQRNAVSEKMHEEILDLSVRLRSIEGVGAVVLTGEGKAFCSGGDFELIEGHRTRGHEWSIRTMNAGAQLVTELLSIWQPVVVAINGHALGLGATIALCGDYIVMDASAQLGDTHVKVGLVAGDGGTLLWPALIGPLRAKELLMSGDLIGADRAQKLGLVSEIAGPGAALKRAIEKAESLASGPRMAIAWTKQLVNAALVEQASTHMALALAVEARSMALPDFAEGIDAIMNRREPIWPSAQHSTAGPDGE